VQSSEIERNAYVDDAGFRNREEGGCGLLQSSKIDRKADVERCRVHK
jgi:hypothetical protein